MVDQRVQVGELVTGAGHTTLPDVANRFGSVEHTNDGKHGRTMNQDFAGIMRVMTPSNGGRVYEYSDVTNAQTVGAIEFGHSYNATLALKTITGITRSGATATATCAAHGYSNGNSILIQGANEPEYNGVFTISNVSTNTFDFTVSGSPATPATATTGVSMYSSNGSWTRGVTGSCFLEKWLDDGTTKEIWYAPSASAGVAPAWQLAFKLDMVNNRVTFGNEMPNTNFEVYGAGATFGGVLVQAMINDTATGTTGTGGGIAFRGKHTGPGGWAALGIIKGVKENNTADNYASCLLFYTRLHGLSFAEALRIDSNGRVGIGISSITAKHHIAAGSATVNTAPQKFTSGTVETTARAGLMEYNGNFFNTKENDVRYGVGGSCYYNYTQIGNTAATETDAFSHTIKAGTLSVNGGSIEFWAAGTFAATASTDKRIKVKFGTTTIFDSGALATTSAFAWSLKGVIARIGASTQKCFVEFHTIAVPGVNDAQVSYTTAAETLANAITMKLTLFGTNANDVVGEMYKENFNCTTA